MLLQYPRFEVNLSTSGSAAVSDLCAFSDRPPVDVACSSISRTSSIFSFGSSIGVVVAAAFVQCPFRLGLGFLLCFRVCRLPHARLRCGLHLGAELGLQNAVRSTSIVTGSSYYWLRHCPLPSSVLGARCPDAPALCVSDHGQDVRATVL